MTYEMRPIGDEILIVTDDGTQIDAVLEFGELERIESATKLSNKNGVTPSIEIKKPNGEILGADIYRVQKFGKSL